VELRVYAPQKWQIIDLLSLILFLLGRVANSSIALAEALVVAGRGGSCHHRFTLSISLYLCLILWSCIRLLGFGLFNFRQKLMWQARVPIFWNFECGWSMEFELLHPLLGLCMKWV